MIQKQKAVNSKKSKTKKLLHILIYDHSFLVVHAMCMYVNTSEKKINRT